MVINSSGILSHLPYHVKFFFTCSPNIQFKCPLMSGFQARFL